MATASSPFCDVSWIDPREAAVVATSPPTAMSGIASTFAQAMPVMALVMPGPLVVRTSAG
jgi:hypothetical protein